MDIKQLEYFEAICETLNITHAAEKMHVSQPSITNAIRRLENELGITLLIRSRKGVQLTKEGQLFKERALDILQKLRDTQHEMQDLGGQRISLLKIGIPPMIGTFMFPAIFSSMKEAFPNLKLELYEHGSVDTAKQVEEGLLDLGIAILPEDNTELAYAPLLDTSIQCVMSPDHPLSTKSKITVDDLKDQPMIMLKEGFYHYKKLNEYFTKSNFSPNVLLSSDQLETIKALVESNIAISFLLKEIVRSNPAIHSVPLADPINVSIGLIWKKDRYLSKTAQEFISFMTSGK